MDKEWGIAAGSYYKLRCGLKVKVLCIDGPGNRPVVGYDEEGALYSWRLDGTFDGNDSISQIVAPWPIVDGPGFYRCNSGRLACIAEIGPNGEARGFDDNGSEAEWNADGSSHDNTHGWTLAEKVTWEAVQNDR